MTKDNSNGNDSTTAMAPDVVLRRRVWLGGTPVTVAFTNPERPLTVDGDLAYGAYDPTGDCIYISMHRVSTEKMRRTLMHEAMHVGIGHGDAGDAKLRGDDVEEAHVRASTGAVWDLLTDPRNRWASRFVYGEDKLPRLPKRHKAQK